MSYSLSKANQHVLLNVTQIAFKTISMMNININISTGVYDNISESVFS